MYDSISLRPPIKLFEAFSGVGTQAMALKRITQNFELVGFSEIDSFAIKVYHAIHGEHVKNYGDIRNMKEIPPCDIFTWSFPCTDLSKAGRKEGMTTHTRSGLVYEVLRLLANSPAKPKVLIMENVVDLLSETFSKQFATIQNEIESYGYKNYVETLSGLDYNVLQSRTRVFMVSVLGDYSYEFPKKLPLKKTLKDYFEGSTNPQISYALNTREHRATGWLNVCPTLLSRDAKGQKVVSDNGIIRKLTPREYWRFMGIDDQDFEKAQAVCSNSQLYKQAGNAIIVDVFENILRSMIYV